jgi:AraC-like DNA-binding protein
MTKVWSSAEVHPRDRLAWWVDQISAICEVGCEPKRDARFFGQGRVADLSGVLQIGTGTASAQVFDRTNRFIACGDDRLFVVLAPSSRHLISQDGREAVIGDGDFVLTDRTRPYRVTADTDFAQTVLMIPRQSLIDRIGSPEAFTAIKVDAGKGFGRMLSLALQTLPAHLNEIPRQAIPRVAENILDLVATAFLIDGGRPLHSPRMTYVRIKFWIERHLGDNLTGERVAAASGISLRHLNRLFSHDGTSLMRHIWQRRLARCHQDLIDPAMSHRSISEIAFSAGFKELAHFSRAYRARYGRSAREERHGSQSG